MDELIIPPEAQDDPEAFEILRVWAANRAQCVTLKSDMNGDSHDFGYLLAQLAYHGANLYSERESISVKEGLKRILEGFQDEIDNPTGDVSGGIMK
jgi:hypothetical protein